MVILWRLRSSRRAEPAGCRDRVEPDVPPSPWRRLRQMSDGLLDEVVPPNPAHTRATCSRTRHSARRSRSSNPIRAPLKLVTDYVGRRELAAGDGRVRCALRRAPIAPRHCTSVVAGFRHCRPWPMYYVLRYFDTLELRPPVGRWCCSRRTGGSTIRSFPALLAEHFTARSERGDQPAFGDGLARATRSSSAPPRALLRKIDNPTSRQLLEALATFRRRRSDREYLQSFGRFVEDEAERRAARRARRGERSAGPCRGLHPAAPPRSLLVVGEPRSGKDELRDTAGDARAGQRLDHLRGRRHAPAGRSDLHRPTRRAAPPPADRARRGQARAVARARLPAAGDERDAPGPDRKHPRSGAAGDRYRPSRAPERDHAGRVDQGASAAACRENRTRPRAAQSDERCRNQSPRRRSRPRITRTWTSSSIRKRSRR